MASIKFDLTSEDVSKIIYDYIVKRYDISGAFLRVTRNDDGSATIETLPGDPQTSKFDREWLDISTQELQKAPK